MKPHSIASIQTISALRHFCHARRCAAPSPHTSLSYISFTFPNRTVCSQETQTLHSEQVRTCRGRTISEACQPAKPGRTEDRSLTKHCNQTGVLLFLAVPSEHPNWILLIHSTFGTVVLKYEVEFHTFTDGCQSMWFV